MGNVIHVHIKHEIEYGDNGFNWQIDELRSLLEDSGCYICGELNDDSIGDWEIPDDQFIEAIKHISNKSEEEIRRYFEKDYHEKMPNGKFKEYVVNTLRTFAKTGDHRKGYYHFSWF